MKAQRDVELMLYEFCVHASDQLHALAFLSTNTTGNNKMKVKLPLCLNTIP